MKRLTPAQRRVLHFILNYIYEHDFQPSIREVRDHFHWTSTVGPRDHIHYIGKKGYISYNTGLCRAMTIHWDRVAWLGYRVPRWVDGDPARVDSSSITATQHETLESIINSYKERDFAPTVIELMNEFGYTSKNTIHERIERLEALGFLSRPFMGAARSITMNWERIAEVGLPYRKWVKPKEKERG